MNMDYGAHIQKRNDHAQSTVIEITGLNKWYDNNHVLKDVALSVQAGDKVVICGPSGSGKSTLIRCINGLEQHQSGTLIVQGNPLDTARKIHDSRQTVGMVFQQFNLFPHLTVLDNLVLAPKLVQKISHAVAVERAMHYLKKVKLADYCGRFPGQLSGGQQQRVAIARALCMQPSIMLFDEPTSALDPETIGEVLDTMIELAGSGMTMLCVTHEMTFARRVANRILFMDQGQILEDRTPDDFFENPGTDRLKRFLSQILSH